MDGHPDNVAASLLGGMTVSWTGERLRCAAIGPASGLATVIVPASAPLATPESRHLLPAEVPHRDAARNSAWSGVLVAGMTLGDPELIAEGLRDCIHEPYRAQAVPDLDEVRSALVEAGALGGALSGAGPAVVGLVHGEDDESALELAREVAREASGAIQAMPDRDAPRALGIERTAPVAV
jgi:homoserine kinase